MKKQHKLYKKKRKSRRVCRKSRSLNIRELSEKSKETVLKKLEKLPNPNINKFSRYLDNLDKEKINDDNVMKLVDKFFDNYQKEIKEYVDKNQMVNPIENKVFRENVGKVIKQKTYSTGLLSKLLLLIGGIAGYYAYYNVSHSKNSKNISSFQSYSPPIESSYKLFNYDPNPVYTGIDFITEMKNELKDLMYNLEYLKHKNDPELKNLSTLIINMDNIDTSKLSYNDLLYYNKLIEYIKFKLKSKNWFSIKEI